EGSVAVTLGRCSVADGDGELPSIGRPLPNTRVYILDEELQPVAIGETGELCLGGVAVARGYLNRPELTAQRFLPDPYSPHPGDRIYRTGDLARFRPDGRVEFLGRLDHQVKLRGFRIELGEVEAALLRHPAVGHCVALAREDEPGDRRLVAYVVPRAAAELSIGELREFLRVSLPEFMIPSAFVALAALPLTSHGKVDRAALPPPGRERPALLTTYVAPRSAAERALASLFAAVLQVDEVGVDDDFFALGGHSLLVGQAAALIAARFSVELPLRELFANPTVAALASRLDALRPRKRSGDEIERTDRSRRLPLSPSQQQVWLTSQLAGTSPLYNEPYALTIRGPLDADRLAAALSALIARHDILRTGFAAEDGEPVQKVHPALPLALDLQDLSELPLENRAATVQRLHDELARAPFDLRSPPLLRCLLVRLAADEHRLLLTLHHAIFDGVSFNQVLLPELVRLYRGGPGQPAAALPAPQLQYADYAAWARARCTQAALSEQLDYWRRQLAELPVLQLPTDYPRPAGGSFRGARHPVLLPPELAEGLSALAQREGATLYMALLTAFAALLHRYSGQDDFAIAGVASTQARPELQGVVGPFVNTVVLRARLAATSSFSELLGRLRETVVAAMDHTELPFAQLVEALRPERHLGQHPLFQVLFLLDPPGPELPAGWSVSRFAAHNGAAMCDLSLQLDRRPEGLLGFLEYSTDLFAPATIARWAGHLETLLRDIVARPTAPLGQLALLPASEQAELARFRGGQREFPVTACLHELFAAQAARTPDAVALTCEQTRLTYSELAQRVNQLAARLQALGIGPDTPVGLCAERSPELVIGILGILRAGGAYVPLDPVYPRERLSFILNDTAAPVLVTHAKVQRALPPAWTGAVVLLDELASTATAEPLPAATRPEHLAYIIYTSGSTGQPKGVPITHRNVARLFLATDSYFGFTASDVFCLFHSFAFDFSVWELWGALLYGGRLVVVPYWVSRSAEAFYRLLRSESVTVLNQTPSAFYQLIQAAPLVDATSERLLALRLVIFGGEALDLGALVPWFERHGEQRPRLYNMYGITETTVHVTCQPLGRADCDRPGSIIGAPLPDLYARV
ncbi:MAG TPA: AMP-binding protein, partial [Pseudomonadota bacterium]|nr:AMP-binding protein [Pseudomonadota bacterium]